MATLTALAGEALFSHGGPSMIDWTPEEAVDVGDVVLVGNLPCIAHLAIPADTLGAIAKGGAHYNGIKDGTSGPVFAAGDRVYWDNTARLFVETETSHFAGHADADAATDQAFVRFHHTPEAGNDES